MPEKTEKNLAYAFAAESKAAARNAAFSKKAEMEGYAQIARLFRAISDAESVHARRYLLLMRGKIGSTEENLETAFQNEIKANVEEYPKLIKDASGEGKERVLKAFSQSRDVENGHAELYKKAMNHMLTDRDRLLCMPGLWLRQRGRGSGKMSHLWGCKRKISSCGLEASSLYGKKYFNSRIPTYL